MSGTAKLIRQGNSTAVVVPKAMLDEAGLQRGDVVSVEPLSTGDGVTIRRLDERRAKAWRAYEASEERYAAAYAELAK